MPKKTGFDGLETSEEAAQVTDLRTLRVRTQVIENHAITKVKLAEPAVGTSNIEDLAVTLAKLATAANWSLADTITALQIAANAVGSSELADGAVDAAAMQGSAIAGFFEDQVLEDQAAGAADIAIGSGDTQIFVATITLPAGWTSMAVTVDGYCTYNSTGGTPARFTPRRESPTSTLLRTGRLSTPGGAAGGVAGYGGPDKILDVLGTLTANRTYRYSALYTIAGTSPEAGVRYFVARKRRVS